MKDHDSFYKEVGRKIRFQRGKKLSQEALASAVGLKRTSISNIEKGRQKLLLHTFVDIAKALKTVPEHLLPEHPVPKESIAAMAFAGLEENEKAFIESAIGLKQGSEYVRKEKENSGNDGGTPKGGKNQEGTNPSMEDSTWKRRADRR